MLFSIPVAMPALPMYLSRANLKNSAKYDPYMTVPERRFSLVTLQEPEL